MDEKFTLNNKEVTREEIIKKKEELKDSKTEKLVEVTKNNFVTRLFD